MISTACCLWSAFNIITQGLQLKSLLFWAFVLSLETQVQKVLKKLLRGSWGVIECKPITSSQNSPSIYSSRRRAGKGEAKTYSALTLYQNIYIYIYVFQKDGNSEVGSVFWRKSISKNKRKIKQKRLDPEIQVELAKNNPHTFYHIMTPTALQSVASTAAHVVKRHETHWMLVWMVFQFFEGKTAQVKMLGCVMTRQYPMHFLCFFFFKPQQDYECKLLSSVNPLEWSCC